MPTAQLEEARGKARGDLVLLGLVLIGLVLPVGKGSGYTSPVRASWTRREGSWFIIGRGTRVLRQYGNGMVEGSVSRAG
jgi:hypothetical protein